MTRKPVLTLSSSDMAMADDLTVSVDGAPPHSDVEVSCAFCDDGGTSWRATCHVIADADGAATLDAAEASSLFFLARPADAGDDDSIYLRRAMNDPGLSLTPVLEPLAASPYALQATSGGFATEQSVMRRRLPESVTVKVPEGGVSGRYFAPADGRQSGAVLLIGGSEGGIQWTRAAQLAGRGFGVLAIAWHQYEGRPSAAFDIPVEYFIEGLDWLRRRTGRRRVAVWGSSRGSEAAVLVAAQQPEQVSALVAWVPTYLAHPGLNGLGGRDYAAEARALWSINGKPAPTVRFPVRSAIKARKREDALSAPPGWRASDEYLAIWNSAEAASAELPAHAITAAALLVAGEDDGLWPSAVGATRLAERLVRSRIVDLVSYHGVGHAIGVPHEAQPFVRTRIWRDGYFGVEQGFIDVGGNAAAAGLAARDSFSRACSFLLEHAD